MSHMLKDPSRVEVEISRGYDFLPRLQGRHRVESKFIGEAPDRIIRSIKGTCGCVVVVIGVAIDGSLCHRFIPLSKVWGLREI